MRQNVIDAAKTEIEEILKGYLREEGLELHTTLQEPERAENALVLFEEIEGLPLEGSLLQWEIRVILGVFGRSRQCDGLVDGLYRALVAYKPTATELATLLTSLHVEVTRYARSRVKKRATIRYILSD